MQKKVLQCSLRYCNHHIQNKAADDPVLLLSAKQQLQEGIELKNHARDQKMISPCS